MKRLIDERNNPGTPEERLAQLMRDAPRFRPIPTRKHLVRSRIARSSRRPGAWLRGGVALGMALSGVAFAAGIVQHRQAPARRDPLETLGGAYAHGYAATTPSRQMGVPDGAAIDSIPQPEPTPSMANAVTTPSFGVLRNGRTASDETRRKPAGARTVRPDVAPAASSPSVSDGDDPALVLAAIRALRLRHDAPRAGSLLDEYLRVHPGGASSEDALALSIEAADARDDRRAAAVYGERYLAQFPAGRFRALALEAVHRGGH